MNLRLLSALLFTALAGGLIAQDEGISEAQLTSESRFVAAKQAALLGKVDEAIQLFESLAQDDAENDVIQFELGRLYFSKEEFNTAIDHLEKAWDLQQQDAYAYFLAEVYESAGRYREGADLFATLISRQPDEVDLYLRQVDFLLRAQRTDDALSVYNRLENRLGVTPMVSRRKHALYLEAGDTRRAERELLRLVDAFPARLDYRHLLAGYYQSQDEEDKMRETYAEILRIEPADVRAQLALQSDGPTLGDSDELLALIARSDVDLDLKIGRLLSLVQAATPDGSPGESARLDRWLDELVRVHSDQAKALALRGDHYFLTGRNAEAAEAYRKALDLEENIYAVWEQYFTVLYLEQQMEKLRSDGQDALDIFPNRPRLYLYLALAEASRADFSAAENLLAEARLMSAGSEVLGQEVQRIEWLLNKLADEDPATLTPTAAGEDPFATYLHARAQMNAGEVEAALDLLSADAHALNTNALWLELLGDAQSAQNQPAEARASYERARTAGSRSRTLATKLRELGGR